MALSEEQKKKLREELDKMTEDDIKDLNIALQDQLDDEKGISRTERQKALHAFLHPDKDSKKEEEKEDNDHEDKKDDPYFEALSRKFKTR